MSVDIQVEIVSNPAFLRNIRALVRSYAAVFGVPDARLDLVVLAVDEACTNAIRHAYEGRGDEKLEILFCSNEKWIEIILSDQGNTAPDGVFVKRKFKPPDPETIQPGGLGVQLMFSVFDEVKYYPGEEGGNKVIMRLKRPDKTSRGEGMQSTAVEEKPHG